MAQGSPALLREQPIERQDEKNRYEGKRDADAMKRRRWNRHDHPSKERDQHDRIDHQPFRAVAHMNETDSGTENEKRQRESIEQRTMAEVVSAVPAQSVSVERVQREIEALRDDLGGIRAAGDSLLGVRPFPGQQRDLVDSAEEVVRLAEGALRHEWTDDGESRDRRQHETSPSWSRSFADPSQEQEHRQHRQ